LPVVLISIEGDEARGSARSVPDTDVKVVLDRCAHVLVRHGGHAQAAGMTLRARDIDTFREAFLSALRQEPQSGPVPEAYDLDLDLNHMSMRDIAALVQDLENLEPFGSGNRKPVFRCRGLRLHQPPTALSGGLHLRFRFRGPSHANGNGEPALAREFLAFGSGEAWRRRGDGGLPGHGVLPGNGGSHGGNGSGWQDRDWDILFQLTRSTFRPRGGAYDPVQQLLVDMRPAGSS
jgi:hypothetical protein